MFGESREFVIYLTNIRSCITTSLTILLRFEKSKNQTAVAIHFQFYLEGRLFQKFIVGSRMLKAKNTPGKTCELGNVSMYLVGHFYCKDIP